MYKLPQEIEVWYIIPRIRRELADRLVNKHGLSYEKAGKILGITKAAVSQYLKKTRASKIKLSKQIQKEVTLSAERIMGKSSTGLSEIQLLLKKMKETKCSCNVCKEFNKEVLGYCNCNPYY